jgi:ATP-binding cassette subfamily B protein
MTTSRARSKNEFILPGPLHAGFTIGVKLCSRKKNSPFFDRMASGRGGRRGGRRGESAEADSADKKRRLNKQSMRDVRVLFRYLQPYRWRFVAGLVMLFLSGVTSLSFPYAIGQLVDKALKGTGTGPLGSIDTLALLLLGAIVLQSLFSFLRVTLFVQVAERSLADLRQDLYARLVALPMSFFANRRVGELTSRMSSDISLIQDTLTFTLAELVRGLLIFIIGVGALLFLSPELTLVMLSTFPIMVVLAVVFGRYIRKVGRDAQDRLADTNVVLEETLQGIQSVKAFANEWHELARYRTNLRAMVRIALKGAMARGLFTGFIILMLLSAIVLLLWYGAGQVQRGEITVGDLTSFIVYAFFVGGALGGFSEFWSQIQKTLGATERVRELLQEPTETVPLTPPTTTADRLAGKVELNDVRFTYPSRPEVEVLKGLSFTVEPGQRVALVGSSGAGKSTVISLLLRFYDPSSGELRFDGKAAADYPLAELRSQMALVPQDVLLFGGTIRENIAYGKLGATDAEIEDAARKANAHDFIAAFPEGYQTVVGERGVKLSGGQRQRVAIARAVLADPAILLLDEATSSLDSESERLVQQALDQLMEGRTSLIIAHRLSTIRNADRILVLHNGLLAETGTHDELMQQPDGLYRMLATLQFDSQPVG